MSGLAVTLFLGGWRGPGPDGAQRVEGFVCGAVHASYLHTHWAGNPSMATSFVGAAALAGAATMT